MEQQRVQETPEDGPEPTEEEALTLQTLQAAFAGLLSEETATPPDAEQKETQEASGDLPANAPLAAAPVDPSQAPPFAESPDPPSQCEISPRTVLEAILFVGDPNCRALSPRTLAGRMRGVSPQEVEQLVDALNQSYAAAGCAYTIESTADGYRMALRGQLDRLRDKFYGRIREARLSQAAIDVLALVAYRQPLTRQKVDDLRGAASGSILSQLVRRRLLRIERDAENPRIVYYFTTDRFLDLFSLDGLTDLPQVQEFDSGW